MSVFMNNIAPAGEIAEIRKGIGNCAKIEKEKKMRYGLKKAKYMMVKTGKEREEIVQEKLKSGAVQKTETYHYLGITINEEGNLEEHIKVIARKCETISREIDAIGAKNQVGKEEIRVKLKLFDTCLMTALTYGMEAWANIRSVEMREIEKIQGKALKRIFQLPVSTTYTGIIMETGIWPAEQKIQYATMMLYHNIKNSDDNRKVKQVVEEQEQNQFKNTFYQKVQKIAKDLQIDISDVTSTSKSKWKKKGKRESNRQNKKKNERRYAGKNKMSNTTE